MLASHGTYFRAAIGKESRSKEDKLPAELDPECGKFASLKKISWSVVSAKLPRAVTGSGGGY